MTINASIAFLMEAAVYFTKRPTGGEDLAHWSNVLNAENCTKAADLITQQSLRIEELEAVRAAAQVVFDGLLARIDNAAPTAVPVFAGIAELSDALSALNGEQG